MSILILAASSMVQNHAFGDGIGNFGILASTYTNTSPGTSISGDLGFTTGPAVPATVSGVIHTSDSEYSQAGTAQNDATSSANSQTCTTNLGTSVDLSLVNGGVYTPGVYCTTGAASIGTGGITLSGNGIYIFKIDGALTTIANSAIMLTNGAQDSSVSWVPIQATTLGANSNFAGTILDAAGVTIGNSASITGRVLAFGGTVSTDANTITVTNDIQPSQAPTTPPATPAPATTPPATPAPATTLPATSPVHTTTAPTTTPPATPAPATTPPATPPVHTTPPSGPLYATGDTTVPEFGPLAGMIIAISTIGVIVASKKIQSFHV